MNDDTKVYALFYNHDDNYDITSLIDIFASLEGAKLAVAEQYTGNGEGELSEWERLKDWSAEAYEAYRDKWHELYYRIVVYEVKP